MFCKLTPKLRWLEWVDGERELQQCWIGPDGKDFWIPVSVELVAPNFDYLDDNPALSADPDTTALLANAGAGVTEEMLRDDKGK